MHANVGCHGWQCRLSTDYSFLITIMTIQLLHNVTYVNVIYVKFYKRNPDVYFFCGSAAGSGNFVGIDAEFNLPIAVYSVSFNNQHACMHLLTN